MKKIYGLLLVALLSLTTFTIPVSAASDINNAEAKLVAYLTNYSKQIGTVEYKVDNDLLTKVQNYLIRDEVDLTDNQVEEVIILAEKGLNTLADKGIMIGSDLNDVDAKAIIAEVIKPICDKLGLTLSYDAANDIITIKNANGDVVYTDDEVIKDTGSNASVVFTVMGLLVIAAGLGFTFYKKESAQA